MSEALETWADAAIGETREALVQNGRAIALRVRRQGDEGRRARWHELYFARVREIDRRRRGAFLDLGLRDEQGFLPLHPDGRPARQRAWTGFAEVTRPPVLTVGQGLVVCVVREAARGKNPVVALVDVGDAGEKPHRMAEREGEDALLLAKPADAEMRFKLDAVVEEALARTAPIPGGGVLTIEPTSALVAIDVDAGGRAGAGDPEKFALDLNIAAAREAARQVRLRNLGGVIALDFVSMRAKSHRAQVEQAVRAAFAGDPWTVQFGALSRFGVFELAREQMMAPLHEIMLDADGRPKVETVALNALRAIEREARAVTGRQIACSVSSEVKAWLDAASFDWRSALSNRIGMRWTLEASAKDQYWPREKIDVRTL